MGGSLKNCFVSHTGENVLNRLNFPLNGHDEPLNEGHYNRGQLK